MIGAGGISRTHCQGWTRLDDCELVAIADIHREAAERRAEEYNIPSVESSGRRLLGRKDIDAVDLVVPNRFHKQYTVAALQAGKHVLCEKPLALTVREVDAMIAAARQAGRKLMCAQHHRFDAASLALKDYLAAHPLGQVYYARAWYNRRRLLPCTPGFMYRRNAGGGCCIDVGVHMLDLALHLMANFQPVSVTGLAATKLAKRPDTWSEWGRIDHEGIDVEDFAAGLIRFADGAALSLECSFLQNQGPKSEMRIDLFGTEAGAKWPDCEYYSHSDHDYVDVKIDLRGRTPSHAAEIESFARSVLADEPVAVPAEQSRAVVAVIEGLYKSARTGRPAKLAP
jgi:predicted dehydrogenase